MLVGLRLPPLAQRYGPGLFAFGPRKKLDLASSSLAGLPRPARARAGRRRRAIRRASRSAKVSYRYRTILDGLAVSLRYRDLPRLMQRRRGAQGLPERPLPPRHEQEPVGDPRRHVLGDHRRPRPGDQDRRRRRRRRHDEPVLQPGRLLVPGGLPEGRQEVDDAEGDRRARVPGPGLGPAGPRSPLYRPDSFHGTHVAGIAAGVAGTIAPAGPDHPTVTGLSGIAPRAWIGNYRVFNVPTPTGGLDAFTPEIVLAFEAAVNDGMDVINFSGGGPEIDPVQRRADRRARQRRRGGRRPGHLGRERPRRLRPRLGRLAEQRARRRSRSPRSRTCTSSAAS